MVSDLFLQNNHIKNISPGAFPREIFYLDLKNNDLEELQTSVFANIGIWKYLDLSNNSLINLQPGAFANSTLTEIRLGQNKLQSVKIGIFNGTKINILDLQDNEISNLEEECFYDMHQISSIDLRNNKITKFRKYRFNDLQNLRFIWLEGNPVMNDIEVSNFKDEIPNLTSFKKFIPDYSFGRKTK